jgi:hypothetical protein
MLKAEVAGIGFPDKGTPQGGIISPLLSNIVLNELDWWVTSQWENMPTRLKREYVRSNNGVVDKAQKYEMLREKSNLKECYIVRYADDFKIFCRKRSDAEKLFAAVEDWLKERLGLDISPEKSMIVNLKKRYSEYLGFKLKAVPKGKKRNGEVKYTVESHMSDKAIGKIKANAKKYAKGIEFPTGTSEEFKAVNSYNAYVSGVHNYYRFATHISKDFRRIALGITRTLQNRLRDRLKTQGNKPPPYIEERYGKSKQLRFVSGNPIIPIGYVQTKAPLYKKREINEYTPEGRTAIHKQLEVVDMRQPPKTLNFQKLMLKNRMKSRLVFLKTRFSEVAMSILHYLMRNPLQYASIELNVNRLSLYCAQHGKCSVTKKPMEFNNIHCHHKTPRKNGGTDRYANLVLVSEDVHMLIHATDENTIRRYLILLKLDRDQVRKLNTLRKKAGVPEILK